MLITLNGETLVAPLPDVPSSPVTPVVAPDLRGHPPLHEALHFSERLTAGHDMEMIGHQAERKNRYVELPSGFGEQGYEVAVITRSVKNSRAAVAAIEQVKNLTVDGPSRYSWHVERLRNRPDTPKKGTGYFFILAQRENPKK